MAYTRLGLHGGPRAPYGSFAGKSQAVEEPVRVGRTMRADFRGAHRAEFRAPVRADFRTAKRDVL